MSDSSRTQARKHHRPEVRLVFLLLGLGFVAIGVAGIFLPVLPTTPFMLLAAACFARSSERFYHWLLNHRVFGATVREWQQHHSIPRRTKWFAIATMAATLAVSVMSSCRTRSCGSDWRYSGWCWRSTSTVSRRGTRPQLA